MITINVPLFLSSIPNTVAMEMGTDHTEFPMAGDEQSSFYSKLAEPAGGRQISKMAPKTLSPGIYILNNVLPLSMGRSYEHEVLSLS